MDETVDYQLRKSTLGRLDHPGGLKNTSAFQQIGRVRSRIGPRTDHMDRVVALFEKWARSQPIQGHDARKSSACRKLNRRSFLSRFPGDGLRARRFCFTAISTSSPKWSGWREGFRSVASPVIEGDRPSTVVAPPTMATALFACLTAIGALQAQGVSALPDAS